MKRSKKLNRKLGFLIQAEKSNRGIMFHREGGMAMSNPDIKELIRDGLLVFKRKSGGGEYPLPPKKFQGRFMKEVYGRCLCSYVNVTFGCITDKGLQFLEKHRHMYIKPIKKYYSNCGYI